MEQQFQTSFIPKKPLAEDRIIKPRSVGVFSFLATIIFIASIVAGGGVYFYEILLTKQVASSADSLKRAQDAFEPTVINDLVALNKRLNSANDILNHHIAVTPIFKTLGDTTLKSIQYTKFDYSIPKGTSNILIKMSGKAPSYQSIAIQADNFGQNKYLIDPVFSNLNLDDKGSVNFDLTFSVDPSFVSYSSNITKANQNPTQ